MIDGCTLNKSTLDKNKLPPQMIENNHSQSFSNALCTTTEKKTKELTKAKISEVNPEDKETLLIPEVERSLEQETNDILPWTRDDSKSLEISLQESKPREFIRVLAYSIRKFIRVLALSIYIQSITTLVTKSCILHEPENILSFGN